MTARTPSAPQGPWEDFANRLVAALHLSVPPIAISFNRSPASRPAPAANAAYPLAPPNEFGRTGSAPAGCVFWVLATQSPLTTFAADHANCSVGSLTHGFQSLGEVADNDDVAALLASGWVDEVGVSQLPVIRGPTESVTYAPLRSVSEMPDVVLLRTNARGLMILKDAVPALPVEGKPQCHIVAMAHEQNQIAASVGCALSRARTGMKVDEATCVIPGRKLEGLVAELEFHEALDARMAHYAGVDARRFPGLSP
jgi:uncharacterized protein (DUF169 family)